MKLRSALVLFALKSIERLAYYPRLKRFYQKNLPPAPFIIDVGANKGQTIDFFLQLRKNCHIWSFEPNPSLAQHLEHKYRPEKNIAIIPKGVSEKNGTLTFHLHAEDESSTFEELNYDSRHLGRKALMLGISKKNFFNQSIAVETVRLCDFLKQLDVETIDLIKIDVEGHEFKCLMGLFEPDAAALETSPVSRIRFIQIESHEHDMYKRVESARDITSLLNRHGFFLERKLYHGFASHYDLIFRNKKSDLRAGTAG